MKKTNFVPLVDNELNKERLEILQDVLKSLGIASRINKSNENGVAHYVLTVEEQYLDEAIEVVKVYGRDEAIKEERKNRDALKGAQKADKTNKPQKSKQSPEKEVKGTKKAQPSTKKETTSKSKDREQESDKTIPQPKTESTKQERKTKEQNNESAGNEIDETQGGYLVPVFNDANGSARLAKIQVYLRQFDIHSWVVAVKKGGKTQYKLVVYPYDYKEATMHGLQFCEKANVTGLHMEGIEKPIVKGFAKNNERIIENEVKERQTKMYGRHGDDNNVVVGGTRNEGSKIEAVSISTILEETGNDEVLKVADYVLGGQKSTESKFASNKQEIEEIISQKSNPNIQEYGEGEVQLVSLEQLSKTVDSVIGENNAFASNSKKITRAIEDPKASEELKGLLAEEKAKMPKPTQRAKGSQRTMGEPVNSR